MGILDTFLILLIHVLCFVSGLALSDRYHREAKYEQKHALEQQYQRLMAGRDADDPCKPYVFNNSDTDGDQFITQEFMDKLHENGAATMKVEK